MRPGNTRLSLLGRFSLERDGRAIRLRTRKEEALLAYVVLHAGSHSREVLAELFWGDTPEQQARASLRAALADVRAAVGQDALVSDRVVVEFCPAAIAQVDVLEFQAQATRFLGDAAPDPAAFDPSLYTGELLAGHYDDWVLGERDKMRQLYLEASLHRVGRLRSLGRYSEAITAARQVLAVDASEERAHQHLIFLHAITGNRPAALRQLEICRRSLKEELDVEPSAETVALAESVAGAQGEAAWTGAARATAGRDGLMGTTAAGAGAALTNLPTPLTSFVGREQEMAEVGRLLQEDGAGTRGHRLVTLTGAGGSGKTRLAIEAARQMIPQRSHGVWWVDLSALRDPALVPDTMLAGLGRAAARGQPSLDALVSYLRERSLLLVLDNCEHLAEACAHLVTAILGSCAEVQVLATSREPLGVACEQLWPVPACSIPTGPADPDVEHPDVERLLHYDAVRLFVERARMHRPAFRLTTDNAAQVSEICRQVDGIPLAIELAAARVRTMDLDDILSRLCCRLRLLATGSALAPPRQQTLRASIDWSYNQLRDAECTLLQRLAVFAGGFTLATAESVCAGGELAEEQVLDLLGRLVDRSLVVAEGRYRLLGAIREYALERLVDTGEAEAVRDRHSAYFLNLVREQEGRLCSRDQKAALAEMGSEISNIRLALEWAIDMHQLARLREISFPLLYFYEIRGWHREGESVFRDAAAKLRNFEETDGELERNRQIALLDMETNEAYFTGSLGRPAETYAMHRQCLERLRSIGDKTVLRYSLRYCGNTAAALGKYEEAVSCLAESYELSQAAGRLWDIGIVSAYLGGVEREHGEPERSERYYHEALEIGRKLGDPRLLAFSLNGLGLLLLSLGRPVEAGALAEQALPLAQETADRHDLAATWGLLGQVAIRLSEPARAEAFLSKSMVLWNEMGNAPALTSMYALLGYVSLSAGDLREAESRFRTALKMAARYELVVLALYGLVGLANALAREGEAEAGLELVAFVLQHPSVSAPSRNRAEQLRPELEAQLTPAQTQAIELRARSETLEGITRRLLK